MANFEEEEVVEAVEAVTEYLDESYNFVGRDIEMNLRGMRFPFFL